MPWRNPIKCRILFNVRRGHRQRSQYHWPLLLLELCGRYWKRNVNLAFCVWFISSSSASGVMHSKRHLETEWPSALLMLIIGCDDFTLETIALRVSGGRSRCIEHPGECFQYVKCRSCLSLFPLSCLCDCFQQRCLLSPGLIRIPLLLLLLLLLH